MVGLYCKGTHYTAAHNHIYDMRIGGAAANHTTHICVVCRAQARYVYAGRRPAPVYSVYRGRFAPAALREARAANTYMCSRYLPLWPLSTPDGTALPWLLSCY